MTVKLISHTPHPDTLCGMAAAICTNFTGDPVKALRGALDSGHESVAEHAVFTFEVDGISRVCLAQVTRHRVASYSVQSQRYCGAPSAKNTRIPESIRKSCYMDAVEDMEARLDRLYASMVTNGIKEEDARYLMPEGLPTKMIMTMNSRELRHFFRLRCCNRAQQEIRQMADRMLAEVYTVAPVLFHDAGPSCRYGNCTEGKRSCGHPRREE